MKIEEVSNISKLSEDPPFSPWGYMITPDGTIYGLLWQWWHGVILALLYPELALSQGYEIPENKDHVDTHKFQRFELHNGELPVIRICPSRMIGPPSFDCGDDPATPEQLESLRLIVNELDLTAHDDVSTPKGDMSIKNMWEYMREGSNPPKSRG